MSITCDRCGEKFETPILATVSFNGHSKKYYGCPRCLTDVKKEDRKHNSIKENLVADRKVKKSAANHETVTCKYEFGYLKSRPKDQPIPDECLTCNRMVECLLG